MQPEHVNKLLNTTFNEVEVVAVNKKFDNYNCDIVFKCGDKRYVLEVDGVYWHGVILQTLKPKVDDKP
jgi:hypothetical protein